MQQQLSAKIISIGAWGKGFSDWQDLQSLLKNLEVSSDQPKGPKPEVIPANERRRAPLPVRLAVESSWQAVQASPFSSEELSCVFVSALGDTQLTDYMCQVLATEDKQLSPTKFHNSVHNAAAGYWTISTSCMHAANSIAGYEYSVPLTLLEAVTQVSYENNPMLLTFYDAPVSDVLKPLLKNDEPFAVSLIIAPADCDLEGQLISLNVDSQQSAWSSLESNNRFSSLLKDSPTARILLILEQLAKSDNEALNSISMPLSDETTIHFKWG